MLCCKISCKYIQVFCRLKICRSRSRLFGVYHEKLIRQSRTFSGWNVFDRSSTGGKRVQREAGCGSVGAEAHRIQPSLLETVLKKILSLLQRKTTASNMEPLDSQTLNPPENVRGMKTLNKDMFRKMVNVPGFRVPSQHVGVITPKMKTKLLKIPRIKPIDQLKEDDPEKETHRLVFLSPDKINDIESFKSDFSDLLSKCGVSTDSIRFYELELGYDNWTYQELLRAILPVDADSIAGFSTVGHIVHLNLRETTKDYKTLIGQVLIDKVLSARTVVNKLDTIDNTFRNFEMEVLAGDDDFITTTKENGLSFKLDFSKVYWNPRLGTEHIRVVSSLNRLDVVLDVFAGIGPFSVPSAKKNCVVYANDLNPHSYHWLQENMMLNKVKGINETYNLDGREFLRTIAKEKLIYHWSRDTGSLTARYYIIMNLPAIAVQFLDVFPGLFSAYSEQRQEWALYHEPRVFCYAFTKSEDGEADVIKQAESHLGTSLGPECKARFVRQVAPNKDMYCVMFNLDTDLLFNSSSAEQESERPLKRHKPEQLNMDMETIITSHAK